MRFKIALAVERTILARRLLIKVYDVTLDDIEGTRLMKSLRTPDARFDNLPGYDFSPNYVDIAGLRMHYVDEGPSDGAIILLLHGEPSWSYLYRHIIPPLCDAGFRTIAPDLIGFGKSDKPSRKRDYSYARHVAWMTGFVEALELTDVTLFCQDWGSLIGLRVAAENEHRFKRIALGNGGMPTGDQEMPPAFKAWQTFARFSPVFPVGKLICSPKGKQHAVEVLGTTDQLVLVIELKNQSEIN